MTPATSNTFVVVYQFGKVASTALVEALNEQPGIEAVQSHFLGDAALQSILGLCLDEGINEHFFHHQSGQLFKNLQITRRIKRILGGNEPETKLVVLLTVREPLDWLRSAITQDIDGYTEVFRVAAKRHGIPGDTVADLARPALSAILNELAEILEPFGSIDAYLATPPETWVQVLQFLRDTKLEEFFSAVIRPFDWHRQFVEPVFDFKLDDFQQQNDLLSYRNSSFAAHLFRYEDVEIALPQLAAEIGLDETFTLSAHNVSEGKYLDEEARAAFKSPESRRLAALFSATEYSRRFRYSTLHDPG